MAGTHWSHADIINGLAVAALGADELPEDQRCDRLYALINEAYKQGQELSAAVDHSWRYLMDLMRITGCDGMGELTEWVKRYNHADHSQVVS